MKGYIKKGAKVFQDFKFFEWDNENIIFTANTDLNGKIKCIANGYGLIGKNYGNGAITLYDKNMFIEIYQPKYFFGVNLLNKK